MTQTDERPFTPLDSTRTKRLRFDIADVEVVSGNLNVRGLGKKARVRIAGKLYDVIGAACGLPGCQCDAYIREVER